MIHWKLALRRARLLLIAYTVSITIIAAVAFIFMGIDKQTMKDIVFTVGSCIGVMPTFIMVVVAFVLESGSIHQAEKGEIQEAMLKRYPVPDELKSVEV